MNNILYVENLPASATERSVQDLFSKKGPVTEVKLMLDPSTGRSRGRAFVTMTTPELAAAAMKALHGHSLEGRNIAVTEARPVEERSTTGLIGHGFEAGIGNNTRPEKSRSPKKSVRRHSHGGHRRGR
ncbi:MAG: recognition motif protein [Pedosphaera sp.]|nr:recognition motif protein [Pedosphaera sp.]